MIQIFKVLETGEIEEIKIDKDIKDILKTSEVYIIISDHPDKTIWLWKGAESSVRKKFIGAQKSQDIRGQVGLEYSVVPVDEGIEPRDFLEFIEGSKSIKLAKKFDKIEIRQEIKPKEGIELKEQIEESIDQLRVEVNQLKKELDFKNREIEHLKTDLEISEESIFSYREEVNKLNDLIDKYGKKRAYAKKLQLELAEKEKKYRELKIIMGLLRREKIQLQQHLEQEKKKGSKSIGHIIEIKEEEIPVHNLVKELQEKLKKQRLLITHLKDENMRKTSQIDYLKDLIKKKNIEIKEKEEKIKRFKSKNKER